MTPGKSLQRLCVDKPERFRLADFDCGHTAGLDLDRDKGKDLLARDIERLAALQKCFYSDGRRALLIVLQGMDAAGKDGVIAHVMSGVNPQGVAVHPFKAPSTEELAHDFLWRAARRLPERGQIAIFNRSHYEEVLAVRVRPELLARQNLPRKGGGKNIWTDRFKDIRAFERHLVRNGVIVLKFFLHISRQEQCRRLLDRLEEPDKRWKFSMSDMEDRKLWDKYMAAYEDMIRATSRPRAPWHVVPADHKWFARFVVARTVVAALDRLDLQFPKVEGPVLTELNKVRTVLRTELARGKTASRRKG